MTRNTVSTTSPPKNQLASQTRENSSPIFRKNSTSVKQPKTAAQITGAASDLDDGVAIVADGVSVEGADQQRRSRPAGAAKREDSRSRRRADRHRSMTMATLTTREPDEVGDARQPGE